MLMIFGAADDDYSNINYNNIDNDNDNAMKIIIIK